jgi:uncharacterized protein YukE
MATPLKLGGGDQFSADPQMLRDTAPTYHQIAQQINSLQQSLVSSVQMATGDMFLLLEFAQLASRLEQLQARIDAAMLCASMGLNRVGVALSIAADEYKETDLQVSSTFQRIEDDTNQSNPPHITIPGITAPTTNPGNTPSTNPQPLPQPGVQNPLPGIQNPQKQPVEPLPEPWLPFLPEI